MAERTYKQRNWICRMKLEAMLKRGHSRKETANEPGLHSSASIGK